MVLLRAATSHGLSGQMAKIANLGSITAWLRLFPELPLVRSTHPPLTVLGCFQYVLLTSVANCNLLISLFVCLSENSNPCAPSHGWWWEQSVALFWNKLEDVVGHFPQCWAHSRCKLHTEPTDSVIFLVLLSFLCASVVLVKVLPPVAHTLRDNREWGGFCITVPSQPRQPFASSTPIPSRTCHPWILSVRSASSIFCVV